MKKTIVILAIFAFAAASVCAAVSTLPHTHENGSPNSSHDTCPVAKAEAGLHFAVAPAHAEPAPDARPQGHASSCCAVPAPSVPAAPSAPRAPPAA